MSWPTKNGITFHCEHNRKYHAAVNVKLHRWNEPDPRKVVREEFDPELAEDFAEWWGSLGEDGRQKWADWAIEDGWRLLDEGADEIFEESSAREVEVYSEGRCGGWAIVAINGRPLGPEDFDPVDSYGAALVREDDPEDYDAQMAAATKLREQWAEFEKLCEETCDDLPRAAQWSAYANGFEPWYMKREAVRNVSFYYDAKGA